MAYEKTIWKNREVERPRTFEKIENPDGTITLVPAEGNIIEEGTPIIAENMNKIEQGIKDAHDEIDAHKADNFQHIPYAIATGTNSYAANIQGITALTEGMSIKVKFQNANTGTATLNINGLGAKEIRKSNGNSVSAGNIKAGQILHLVYTGSVFQLLGEGGEYGNVTPGDVIKGVTFGTEEGLKTGTLELTGNAAASQVLTGRTFYTTNPKSKQTGTMPNRGAVTNTITTQGGSYTIPAGYHNGSGKVTANFANLVPENIKSGVNIGGVVGTAPVVLASGTFSLLINSTSDIALELPNNATPEEGEIIFVYSLETAIERNNLVGALRRLDYYSANSTDMVSLDDDEPYYILNFTFGPSFGVRMYARKRYSSVPNRAFNFIWFRVKHLG